MSKKITRKQLDPAFLTELALNGAQKFKITQDDGKSKTTSSDLFLISDPGSYDVSRSVSSVDFPDDHQAGILEVWKDSRFGTVIQRFTSTQVVNKPVEVYVRTVSTTYYQGWTKISTSNDLMGMLSGSAQNISFSLSHGGKFSSSVFQCPHEAFTTENYPSLNFITPDSTGKTELSTSSYQNMMSLSNSYTAFAGNTSSIPQILLRYNVLEQLKRYIKGGIPGANTSEKIAFIKKYLSNLTLVVKGFGNTSDSNKMTIKFWDSSLSIYSDTASVSSTSKFSNVLSLSTGLATTNCIDSNGFVNILIHGGQSGGDAVKGASLSIGFAELKVDFTAKAMSDFSNGVSDADKKVNDLADEMKVLYWMGGI